MSGKNAVLLTTAIAVVAGLPMWNADTTRRVLSAWQGNTVDCSDSDVPFDVMAIADGGSAANSVNPQIWPNSSSKRRIRAAAYEYVAWTKEGHRPEYVYLLKGEDAAHHDWYAPYFRSQVLKFSDGTVRVPPESIVIDHAINTSESARHFSEQFHARHLRRAALFTSWDHANRFATLVCSWDTPASVFAAEDVIAQFDPTERHKMQFLIKREQRSRQTNLWKMTTLPWDEHGYGLELAKRAKKFFTPQKK